MPARYAARGEGAMLPEVPYDWFRIGSQFFTLACRHAVFIVRERRLWRKFRVPCLPEMAQDSCYPEENYFPTLLARSSPCSRESSRPTASARSSPSPTPSSSRTDGGAALHDRGIVPGPSTTKAVAFLFGLCSLHLPSSSEYTLRLFPTSVEKKEKCSVPLLLLLLLLLPVLVVAGVALAGSSDDDSSI
ncbi:hypothetical protein GQ55_3G294300 [Panicum hallii var. hallii]|uniref:Transmembrane protein n=1 Tax=Panicum hallii var. hallii TaxID=1504633 RepID=A0A2T7EEL0_9POAL|nr:hypothetical protein GQ55_3G294300 [Panicum hallii var. hallii]